MVKPIRAIMPRMAELATDQITALGTVMRAPTASSPRSAASSKPTIVKMPIRAAAGSATRSRPPVFADPVLSRKPRPWLGWMAQAMKTTPAKPTMPTISVKTATLLIRAASAMERMLMTRLAAKITRTITRLVSGFPGSVWRTGWRSVATSGATTRKLIAAAPTER